MVDWIVWQQCSGKKRRRALSVLVPHCAGLVKHSDSEGESEPFAIVFAAMGVNMETAHFFKQVCGGCIHQGNAAWATFALLLWLPRTGFSLQLASCSLFRPYRLQL